MFQRRKSLYDHLIDFVIEPGYYLEINEKLSTFKKLRRFLENVIVTHCRCNFVSTWNIFYFLSFFFLFYSLASTSSVDIQSCVKDFADFDVRSLSDRIWLFCSALRTWENDIEPLPKRTLAVKRNVGACSKSSLVARKEQVQRPTRCSHSSPHWKVLRRPSSNRGSTFLWSSIEVQRHCSYRCIILTVIFNVMSGVKFESYKSQGAWSHSEGH